MSSNNRMGGGGTIASTTLYATHACPAAVLGFFTLQGARQAAHLPWPEPPRICQMLCQQTKQPKNRIHVRHVHPASSELDVLVSLVSLLPATSAETNSKVEPNEN